MSCPFGAGERVRLIPDPGRIGITTGRGTVRADRAYCQIAFPDRTDWVPADQLEAVPDGREHPIDLFRRGRIAGPLDLFRTLTHIRLSGRLINFIYSLETTDTDFYAYQFKPVLKLLQSVSTGILIADEVGLGKTIEAGLIWTELRSRFDLQSLVVVCPAMLREKWASELEHRFGVRAQVCNAKELVKVVRNARSGIRRDFAVIASIQGVRPPRNWKDVEPDTSDPTTELARLLTEVAQEDPLIDLLIIDEAHYLRNPDTQSFELGGLLRRAAQYAVLLSATPVNLRSDDLFNLLQIVDEDSFPRKEVFEYVRQANEHLVSAREAALGGKTDRADLQSRVQQALLHPLLERNRQLEDLLAGLEGGSGVLTPRERVEIAGQLETANLLGFAVTRTRRREIREFRAVREPLSLAVQMNEVEERFYNVVTATVQEFCARSARSEGFLLVMPQRQMASCMAAARLHWGQDDSDLADDLYEELGIELPTEKRSALGPLVTELRSRTEAFANASDLSRNDTKYASLLLQLKDFLQRNPHEKVVLFSTFRPTIHYLASRLKKDGISCVSLLGGPIDKEAILRAFRERKDVSVLLSTEVGSEGIDLQFSWVLVNYDLPWNPMKVEQRIGRLDRLGQRSGKIAVWNLMHAGTIDERIYERLYLRLGIFERTLGGLEAILGESVRELSRDLLQRGLTPEQQVARIDQTTVAAEAIRRQEEELEQQASSLVAYGDYIVQQVNAAKDLARRIDAEDIKRYVLDFLQHNFSDSQLLQSTEDPDVVEISLSASAKNALTAFLDSRRQGGGTALGSRKVSCRFENRLKVPKRPGEEVVNQLHPLVRFVAERAEAEGLINFPAVAIKVSAATLGGRLAAGDYLFVVARWSFEALRPLERLWFGLQPVDAFREGPSQDDAERIIMAAVESGDDWPSAADDVSVEATTVQLEQSLLPNARSDYEDYARQVVAQNQDRARAQLGSLDTHLRLQLEKLAAEEIRHRDAGRSLAKATAGRMRALRDRVERQRLAIEEKQHVRHSMEEVCVGVIRVI